MGNADLVVMLERSLEIITDFMDAPALASKEAELGLYIDAAKRFITTEGITLDLDDDGDCQLIVMYAAWLYNKRKDASSAMPRMLRWTLNNRLFQQKMGVS